jgi:hypothetical protein
MKHALWLVVVLCACEKRSAPKEPPPAIVQVGDAAVVDGTAVDAAPARVDLGRSVPLTIRVSSQVRNAKILPRHIADGNLATAWNSATGELVGTWLEVELDGASVVEELRLTVGFTGRGPKGEDYFTMNPRIAKLSVRADGGAAQVVALDPARRDLQSIAVRATKVVRIEVVELVPGTKKNWREVSISELEAWGTPPAGFSPPASPRTPLVVVAPTIAGEPCADIEARKREFEKTAPADDPNCTMGCDDKAYPPDCEVLTLPTDALGTPWNAGFGACDINDEIYGPKVCTLTFKRGAEHAQISVESSAAKAAVAVTEMLQQDVIAGGAPELVVRLDVETASYIAVCRAKPLECTDAIQIADDGWKAQARFENGKLVLDRISGTPPTLGVRDLF